MGLEDQEVSEIAGELTDKKPPVNTFNTFRAARQLERFIMGINPCFRSGVDDLGDVYLFSEELFNRRSREVYAHRDPKSFGKLIAHITYLPDQQRVEIKRVDENSEPESL